MRSYGIYLWHWPIIVLTAPSLQERPSLALLVVQVAATIAVATLSWRFFEEPIRRGALGRLWTQARSGEWSRRGPLVRGRARRRLATRAVVVVALAVLAIDVAGLAGMMPPRAKSPLPSASSGKPPRDPGVSTHQKAAPPDTTTALKTSSPTEAQSQTGQRPERKSSGAASPNMSSCDAIAYIGDSTSEGMVLPSYLPKPGQRLGAQYARVGATSQYFEISGARSIIETLSQQQASGLELARQLKTQGYRGCWMIALGTNDTANVYVGSAVGLKSRIGRMMATIGDQPVVWITVKSLLSRGPYSDANMEQWNRTVKDACAQYPNMRVFDWASLAEDDWFLPEDGSHYTSEGYRHRARLSANALAHALPASGEASSYVVR